MAYSSTALSSAMHRSLHFPINSSNLTDTKKFIDVGTIVGNGYYKFSFSVEGDYITIEIAGKTITVVSSYSETYGCYATLKENSDGNTSEFYVQFSNGTDIAIPSSVDAELSFDNFIFKGTTAASDVAIDTASLSFFSADFITYVGNLQTGTSSLAELNVEQTTTPYITTSAIRFGKWLMAVDSTDLTTLHFSYEDAEINDADIGEMDVYEAYTEGLEYELSQDGAYYTLVGIGTSTASAILIPSKHEDDGLPIIAIGDSAFENCSHITTVVMRDAITEIGSSAFKDCSALVNLMLSANITSIGESAFSGCESLTSFTIPENVTNISDYTFYDCTSLSTIELNSNLESIGSYAFSKCSALDSITIPSNCISIAAYAFYECVSLTSVTFEKISDWHAGSVEMDAAIFENPNDAADCLSKAYCNVDWVSIAAHLEFKLTTDGEAYTVVGIGTWVDSDLIIPATYNGLPVTAIDDYAFTYNANNNANITSVTFEEPSNCITIGGNAFYECTSLESIIIPESVTSIGNYAFSDCTSLKSVVIPDSVTEIGYWAFVRCYSLTGLTIGNGLTSISSGIFSDCTSLKSVNIPDSVISIGSYAFNSCTSLKSVVIPDSVTSIGSIAFNSCTSLESIIIPESVTSIGNYAFSDCTSLKSVVIPDSVTSIGTYVFSDCTSLGSVAIPGSIGGISNSAFRGCTSLTSLTIGSGVISIGMYAFRDCTSLNNVVIPGSIVSIDYYAFYNCTSLNSVEFENLLEWTAGTTVLSETDLSDPLTAAKYLTETYSNVSWSYEEKKNNS